MVAQLHMRGANDVALSALPCPHVYGNVLMNGMMMFGTKLVLHKVFDAADVIDDIARHGVTIFDGVATTYMFMLNSPALADADFSSLTAPTFSEQTIGINFTALTFTYYDATGATVSPTTLALRSTIRRVDLVVGAQTSGILSGGSVDNYAITLSVYPRNLAAN